MAGKFKEYDSHFTSAQITECRNAWLYDRVHDIAQVTSIAGWDYEVAHWTQTNVARAVYLSEGFLDWQLFRVSMKGLTTQEKLHMLVHRYKDLVANTVTPTSRQVDEKIRIDNYLGALVRGGLLTTDYQIKRS